MQEQQNMSGTMFVHKVVETYHRQKGKKGCSRCQGMCQLEPCISVRLLRGSEKGKDFNEAGMLRDESDSAWRQWRQRESTLNF